MAYDQPFLKITFGFSINATDEIAQTGINFSDPANPTFNAAAGLGEIVIGTDGPLVLGHMATLMSSVNLVWANYSRLNYVRFAAIGVDGLEIGAAKIFEDLTPAAGTATGVLPQSSLVASLRSGSTTGSANFGRMYLPHSQIGLAAPTPFTGAGDTAAVATAFQVFVNAVESQLHTHDGLADVEPMIMTQVVGGTSKAVTQVAIGNVVDTQRRRRNQLVETYIFRTIP